MQSFHGQRPGLLVLVGALGVAAGNDRPAELLRELLLRPQKSRHQKVEERPKLEDRVLDGCAGEDEPVEGLELLDGDGRLGLPILDHVTLV